MKVYKFGGASVKSADGVKTLLEIIGSEKSKLVVVVSAMGKTTNMLEEVVNSYFNCKPDLAQNVQIVKDFHKNLVNELFCHCGLAPQSLESCCHSDESQNRFCLQTIAGQAHNDNAKQTITTSNAVTGLDEIFSRLDEILSQKPSLSYDFEYDRIVSFGEILSTFIVSDYLNSQGCKNQFIDVRTCLKSDDNYREGNIDFELSQQFVSNVLNFSDTQLYITQGFIAGTTTNQTTTLGREGSDYSAALLASMLDAESVTIWKDVSGVMNADPKRYSDVQIIPRLSYKEAIELSYCGASVIHPKTVKPLKNKKIPLYVKSFIEPQKEGSVINEFKEKVEMPPIYINKTNQVLLSLTPRDFSFIAEERLSSIFSLLAHYKVKVSIIQSSAISFSLCIDYNAMIFPSMIKELQDEYEVKYNTDVELITIRHYSKEIIDKLINRKDVVLEQRERVTARFVLQG